MSKNNQKISVFVSSEVSLQFGGQVNENPSWYARSCLDVRRMEVVVEVRFGRAKAGPRTGPASQDFLGVGGEKPYTRGRRVDCWPD